MTVPHALLVIWTLAPVAVLARRRLQQQRVRVRRDLEAGPWRRSSRAARGGR